MTSSTSRRRSTTPPPHAKGLLDQLEKSFLHALRSGEGGGPRPPLCSGPTPTSSGRPSSRGFRPRCRTCSCSAPTTQPSARARPSGCAAWSTACSEDVALEPGVVPILYLPGVARQSLRAGDECPRELQPLVELQYRGRVWHQKNGRDWTVEAFLVSEDGLQLDVAQDAKTREAAQRSLPLLAETPLDGLRGHRLEADDFDRLAVSDPTRDLLRWMGVGDGLRKTEGEARWKAFCGVCNSDFKFDPDKKSPADAANALVEGSGKWANVWQRFKEAPKLYPDVAKLLRETATPLLYRGSERDAGGNTKAEQELRAASKRSRTSRMPLRSPRWPRSKPRTASGASGSGPSSVRARWPVPSRLSRSSPRPPPPRWAAPLSTRRSPPTSTTAGVATALRSKPSPQ